MIKRKHQTIADLAAIALCPSLIVLLISSLVYFLVMCVYRGDYSGRIGYIWFMFIMGAVGIARLSIQESRKYAMGYAAVLGLATFVVLSRFITIQGTLAATAPIFNGMVIALVWFLADRITFDCTLIDDAEDASGRGLLDGLTEEPSAEKDSAQHRTRKRGHQPGRTVMWLTAGALPFFGLGQAMLPADERWQRAAIMALGIYLFAALSLMVATSFLGVRRYLRQRGVDMPANVSTAWLAGGVGITLLLLLVCFLLPQPGKMLATAELPQSFESPEWLKPSKYGWGGETASNKSESSDAAAAPPEEAGNETPKPQPSSGDPNAAGKGKGGQGKPDPTQSPSQNASGEEKGTSGSSESGSDDQSNGGAKAGESGEKGQQSASDSSKGDSSKGDSSKGDSSKGDASKGDAGESKRSAESKDLSEQSQSEASAEPGQSKEPKQSPEQDPSQSQPSDEPQNADDSPAESAESTPPETPSSSPSLLDSMPSLTTIFRVLIYLITIGILVAFVWVQRHEIAKIWQAFLAWLRGESAIANEQDTAPEVSIDTIPLRPFASFRNPLDKRTEPREAIIVTYQAAEAWWREHGQPRKTDETPHEFCRRLKPRNESEHEALLRLTDAYNRVVYGGQNVQSPDLAAAADVWKSFANR